MRTLVRVRHGTRDSRADDSVLRDVRVTSLRRADWEHSQRVRGGEIVREHAGWVFRGSVWEEEIVVVRTDGDHDGEYEHGDEFVLFRVIGSAFFSGSWVVNLYDRSVCKFERYRENGK